MGALRPNYLILYDIEKNGVEGGQIKPLSPLWIRH